MENTLCQKLFGLAVLILFLSPAIYAAGPAAVNLGSSGDFAILAKSGISTTGTTSIAGDVGVSPIAATAMTGFGLILDSSNQFATSSLVNGKAYAANYAPPTPTKMTTAVSDMQTAYTDAAGRTNPTATELGAGNIGGMTIAPGLYKWSTGVTIPTGVTLSGGPNDVWIFQIAQTLNVGNGAIVTLSGGAQAKNIFWSVAGQATLGTTSDVKGIILSQTAIVMNTGAKLNGRALAQTAVTLIANAVTAPTGTTPTPTPTPAPAPGSSTTQTSTSNQTTTPTPSQTSSGSLGPSGSAGPIGTGPAPSTQAQMAQNLVMAQNMALGLPTGTSSTAISSPSPNYTPSSVPTPASAPQPAPTPIPASTPAELVTTAPTPPQPASTSIPDSSQIIIPTPVSWQSASAPQSQIAQNMALGLPAGYSP